MLSRALAGAARQVSVSAARAERQLLRDKQMSRLTSTAQPAAPAAEAPKPAAAGSPEPAQSAPKAGERQSNSGAAQGQESDLRSRWLQDIAMFRAAGAQDQGSEWRSRRFQDMAAVVALLGAAAAAGVAFYRADAMEKELDKQVRDAKEAIRVQREALQVEQKALEGSVKTQTWWAAVGPIAASALGFAVAYAGVGVINAAAAAGRIGK